MITFFAASKRKFIKLIVLKIITSRVQSVLIKKDDWQATFNWLLLNYDDKSTYRLILNAVKV